MANDRELLDTEGIGKLGDIRGNGEEGDIGEWTRETDAGTIDGEKADAHLLYHLGDNCWSKQ